MIKAGVTVAVPPAFYGYLAGMVVLAILGAVFQFWMFNKMEEHDKNIHEFHKSVNDPQEQLSDD